MLIISPTAEQYWALFLLSSWPLWGRWRYSATNSCLGWVRLLQQMHYPVVRCMPEACLPWKHKAVPKSYLVYSKIADAVMLNTSHVMEIIVTNLSPLAVESLLVAIVNLATWRNAVKCRKLQSGIVDATWYLYVIQAFCCTSRQSDGHGKFVS